jgi:hypothetical protein
MAWRSGVARVAKTFQRLTWQLFVRVAGVNDVEAHFSCKHSPTHAFFLVVHLTLHLSASCRNSALLSVSLI